jgi:hypothetical protein
MTRLSDEILKQISTSLHCYAYEGRAMALELIARRAAEVEARQKAQTQQGQTAPPGGGMIPLPFP